MTRLDGIAIVGSYDNLTVVLSILIAVLASYTALDLGERVTAARGAARIAWLISGAIAMGIGIGCLSGCPGVGGTRCATLSS